MRAIILDTDIDTDCDDAGALAVLHNLAAAGEVRLLGVICSIPLPACAACVHAINRSYGRGDIPVGLVSAAAWADRDAWGRYLEHRQAQARAGRLYNESVALDPPGEARDAVDLYRRLLAQQADGSVTLCAIGTLSALAALLASKPDAASPLSGRELVARKVRQLVSMANAPAPEGIESFNWRMDWTAAREVIADWPTPLVVQWAGRDVLTGSRLMAAMPEEHPVRRAYWAWLGDPGANRPSWDQLTALYAARGPGDLFTESEPLALDLSPEPGRYRWRSHTGGPQRRRLDPRQPPAALADHVERLMIGQGL